MAGISFEKRMSVYKRDGFACAHCGFSQTIEEVLSVIENARHNLGRFPRNALLTIDHILPLSRGGGNGYSNLQTLCYECNHRKADRVPEGLRSRRGVAPKRRHPPEPRIVTGRFVGRAPVGQPFSRPFAVLAELLSP